MGRKILAIFRFLARRAKEERELDRELQYHVDRQTEINRGRGMDPDEARRQAVLSVGGIEPLKEECRDARAGRPVEALLQDVRYGARVLFKNPGFSAAAIVTLALGIGANTAIFSVVYGVLLRPLPYRDGGRLVVLHQQLLQAHIDDMPFSVKELNDYCDRNHTLSGMVEHHTMSFLLIGNDTAERVETAVVSPNFFDVLGVKPLLGRTFVAADDRKDAPAVLILSHKYWQSHQSGDPNIVGKIFKMNNRPHTVLGVLPPIPQYPSEADVYMPTSQCPTRSSAQFIGSRGARMMTVFGRVKNGVSLAKAQADFSVAASQVGNAYPNDYPPKYGYTLKVAPLETELTQRGRAAFLVLLAGAGFVLLIACANVANLLLARVLKLEREFAVRAALGASRGRLIRQLLTESVMLSLAGGSLGLLLAPAALAVLVKFAERFTTRAAEVHIDLPVLLFTMLVSLATGVLFGLAPAASTCQWVSDAFKQAGGRITSSRSRHRLRGILVIAQVAVSFVLLIGAGLMIRSFGKLQQVNPGFRPDHLVTLRYSPGFPPYSMATLPALMDNVLRKIDALGGVESAAIASSFPLNPAGLVSGPQPNEFEIEGHPVPKDEPKPQTALRIVSPAYFDTIRQPLVKGRAFTDHDDEKAVPVAIINQAMARHRWSGADPIGQRIRVGRNEQWFLIVGIVADVKDYGLDRAAADQVYESTKQAGFSNRLVVRTSLDPIAEAPLLRAAFHQIDPHIAVDQVETMERLEYDSMTSPRVMTLLMAIFAGLALLISSSGIAAVMALSVTQRAHELGIRMALGAARGAIIGMVVRQGLVHAFVGTVIGIGGAALLARTLSTMLYDTRPTDLLTFLAVSLLFLTVAAVACFVPARQVTGIDPLDALRQE
ncbi:MAG: ABC transporter permease [Candidatus Sulfopaludibacter sp.]|nr:ABC transporter permease [Candidatus Sulfopaludibacter sp.]